MPEIGTTLREARVRARIEISEIEAETKIRAKYLRALENEEWDLLPGPTYVKSFLRTYADALGLDGRLLIEEYKLRHERLSDVELQPISRRGVSPRDRRHRERRGVSPGWVIAGVVAALLVVLYILGQSGGGGGENATINTRTPAKRHATPAHPKATTAPKKSAPPRLARLQIEPTGAVYVCLEAAGRRRLINGATLTPATPPKPYRSSRFRLTLGNSNVRLRINGRMLTVPAVANGIGYEITPRGRRTLAPSARPTCT
jgi:cytoskeleton protein RodZ